MSTATIPQVGQRIQLRREVNRSHEFSAPAGMTGKVSLARPNEIHVETDERLEDGGNLIAWNGDAEAMSQEFWGDCEAI